MATTGRRRHDTPMDRLPPEVQPGDYWRCLYTDEDRVVQVTDQPSNLTGEMWMFMAPNGAGIGTLRAHTVRENDDGTATIAPGDGSSNSVLIGSGERSWHGYLDHGVWKAV